MKMKLQKDALDCGAVVVQTLHKYYYDNWISMNTIKEKVNYGIDGLNILELAHLGNQYGLSLEAFEGEFGQLVNLEITNPIIGLINNEGLYHYIIITKIKNKKVYYLDPIKGKQILSFSKFEKIFANIIVLVTKTAYQLKQKIEKNKLFYTDKKTFILIVILNIVNLAFSFISTFYLKIILDKIIPNNMVKGLNYITICFVFIAILKVINILIKTVIVNKIKNKISYSFLNLYFNKIYFCNINKLEKITKNDHLRRINSIQNIASFKANYLFTISNEIISFLFSGIVLIWISPKMFVVIFFLSSIMILISFIFQKNINLNKKNALEKNLNFSSKMVDLIYSQLEVKQQKYRNLIQKNIDHSMSENFKINFKMFNIDIIHKTIVEAIKILIPFIIVYLSTQDIFEGISSIGNMMLFISIFSFFINPLDSFLTLILNIPIVKQDIDLLNFILNFQEEEERGFENQNIQNLLFKNLSFSYELGQELFHIKNLEIQKNIQIEGKNGSGKSTFLKLIATYLKGEGKYKINNININDYNLESVRNNIFYGSINTFLPNVSILQYVTNNEKVKIENFQNKIVKYNLQEIFDVFGIKIDEYIKDNGNNFSSGQKQFIILLPLLVNNYELILLDECFENIDGNNFKILKKLITEIHENKLFIEISHSNKFLYTNEVICFDKFNQYK